MPEGVQIKFTSLFRLLIEEKELDEKKFKKLKNVDLWEFRVKHNKNIYRAIGGYTKKFYLTVLAFQKKKQKTPQDVIKKAIKRLKPFL